jgi:dipeptidyl aminopeptidase/acylaminoacyl peptidase
MTPGQTVAHAALSATLATTLTLFALTGDRLARAATNGHHGGNYVAGVNGPILVLVGRGGLGQTGPTEGEIVAVQHGRVVRVLARGLPFPFSEGLAPSPRGRYVGYGAEVKGLWVATADGSSRYRLLLPPRSTQRNVLGVESVAWSPDRYTLAYAVNIAADFAVNPLKDRGLGIWLTRYDRARPRLLVTPAQLGAVGIGKMGTTGGETFAIAGLSWSPDGRTLAVSTFRPAPGVAQPGHAMPVVLAVDAATGKTRLLLAGAHDAVFAPTSGALAYVTGESNKGGMSLRVADAHGRHVRVLATVNGPIASPAWSPDGRTIAYITGLYTGNCGTEIRTIDVASGTTEVVLTTTGPRQRLLPPGGQFVRLAWMHTRV